MPICPLVHIGRPDLVKVLHLRWRLWQMVTMLEKALAHSLGEIGLHTLWKSVKVDFESIQKGHDSIHEFVYLAPLMFPRRGGPSWHGRSAFLLYHWEIGDTAHRSLLEGLCGYYNSAFTLLRTVLELALKGAVYEGLAHGEFRAISHALAKDRNGENLIGFIDQLISTQPSVAHEMEEVSAAIYDKLESIIDMPGYRPVLGTLLAQVSEWGLLEPMSNVHGIQDAYKRLSKDVHVLPDYTEIGRVLLKEPSELFEPRTVDPTVLREYVLMERFVVDVCAVIELNILKDNVKCVDVGSNLASRIQHLENLGMANAFNTATGLLRR